jgi:putative ABC transport system permease protein
MMPLSLALVHSAVGISVANNVIKMVGHIDASVGIAASATGIILVYGGYMIATYFGCKSMIGNKM